MGLTLKLFLAAIIFPGCSRPVYYLSPSNANTGYYRTIPLKSDSIKAISYLSRALTIGSANYYSSDHVVAFHGSFHRSHQFGDLQGYYGINYTSGFYRVNKVESGGAYVNEDLINRLAGNKFTATMVLIEE